MKKRIFMLCCVLCLSFLAACGSDSELDAFHDEMDRFYDALSTSVNTLENIDPQSETAVDDLLACLSDMDTLFSELAAIEVPEALKDQFENVESLADEASEYMAEADTLYHEAYADDGYDDSLAQAAGEYYSRAMKRINYIAIILQGRLPEDDNIVIIHESESPDWNGGEPETASEETEGTD